MKDVNYREDDWREAKSALAPFNAANWFGGLFNHLEKVSKNMENAEEDIRDLDTDHAIHFQHTDHRSKYGEIEEDLKVLYQFSCHAGEKMETLVDQPFYEKLDAFVDGMEDLSITTYSTTNRIGAKSTQTYMSSYGGQPQVIESVKENATIEDLMNGDNFYANQMNLQYEAWKRANPDQKVSEADFKMGMLHTRAFDYKSIKDEQEEKEFWVNIVAAVVIVGVSIVCPPAGLALGVGFGALEASSAISGKDWISGRELSDQERLLRGGFALLDIIPGVKAFSSGTKIASAGSKILRVGDDLLDGGKLAIKNAGKSFKGTIDTGIQAGKESVDSRIISIKNASTGAQKAIKGKLTKDLNDIGEAAKTIQSKAKETFQIPPRERLELAGVGGLSEPTTIAKTFDAGINKLQEAMSKMNGLNIKGSGKDDIIEGVTGARASKIDGELIRKYVRDVQEQTGRKLDSGQVEKLKEALRTKEYKKLTPSETKSHRRRFNRIKDSLISEWEVQTGQTWPTYTEDIISEKTGEVIRKAGDPYDAHHIIENSYGGEHEWWNIHPAKFPNEHQAGIHGSGSPASDLFK
ncbi:pre-toxin TG domain-containing protein [Listeria seeligeri]|uniref:pre-toxin TG domain-containing protein n=1 Tax=Listeria seeligeri TaxID=1640 RepID=UPI0016237A5F|nr:pre-toxin TG domain-containing protein [Listeria seeligeri]MBC1431034.1 ribonuclease YeeF family protein [Listeria seeligeri]